MDEPKLPDPKAFEFPMVGEPAWWNRSMTWTGVEERPAPSWGQE
jgi:hypothetical protein